MFAKSLAVLSLILLPLSIAFWHRSYAQPFRYRFDVTLYKSLDVYLKDGICGLHLLSMPTQTASRTEFRSPITYDPTPNRASLLFSTAQTGPLRRTWLVFPFWLLTGLMMVAGATPIAQGPIRVWWRRRAGRCEVCGYDLTGNPSGRCSECGHAFSNDNATKRSRPALHRRR